MKTLNVKGHKVVQFKNMGAIVGFFREPWGGSFRERLVRIPKDLYTEAKMIAKVSTFL